MICEGKEWPLLAGFFQDPSLNGQPLALLMHHCAMPHIHLAAALQIRLVVHLSACIHVSVRVRGKGARRKNCSKDENS